MQPGSTKQVVPERIISAIRHFEYQYSSSSVIAAM